MYRPSPDMLAGWLRLADEIERNGATEPVDVELLVDQSALAASGLRRLVEYVRAIDATRTSGEQKGE